MLRKKQVLSILLVVLLLAVFITGCNDKPESSSSDSSKKESSSSNSGTWADKKLDKEVTLTFLVDRDQSMDGLQAVFDNIQRDLNIKTEVDVRPGGSDGDNIVKTRLSTGEMADLCFYNAGSLFQSLNPSKYFVDLTGEGFMSTIDDTFKSTVSIDNKVYGVPSGPTQVGAWMYNKAVYTELGLKVPTTWAELLANCEVIKKAGKTAVIGSYQDNWTSQLIFLADYYNVQKAVPTFADDFTNNKAKFETTPAALKSFEKLREIFDKGYMNSDANATSYTKAIEILASGDGVHWPMLSFALPEIEAAFPDKIDEIGYFGQPGDEAENGVTVWMPAGIYLNNQCKEMDAAKLWMEYFISADGVSAMESKVKATGPYAIKGIEMTNAFGAVLDLVPTFNAGRTAPALEFLSSLKGADLPQITQECGSGISTAKEAARKYDKDVEKQAKQLGLDGW